MDPLFADGIDLTVVLIVLGKVLVTFVFLLLATMMVIWFTRKVIGDMQNRVGPDRAGPWGMLQSVADGVKVFFKEGLHPERSDWGVYQLAPYVSAMTAFAAFAIVPVGGPVEIAGHTTLLQLADPPIGVLFLLAMSSIAVYGVMLAGWSSGSKYPLLGAVRASAQMVSYEAAMGLSVAAVVVASGFNSDSFTGSLSTNAIVAAQGDWRWNLWLLGVVPFVVFLVASTAEMNHPPFDLVEAEQELVGGFHTEYSGVRFALFYLAEFMNTITMSAIAVTLFLGGPLGPDLGLPLLGALSPVWFFAKVILYVYGYVWIRATLPRFRYDQLMDLGWKRLIPIALFWLLLVAALQVGRQEDWNFWLVLAIAFGAGALVWGLLTGAMRVGRARSEEEPVPEVAEVGG